MDDRQLSDRDHQALASFRHALRVFLRFSEEAAREADVTPAQHQLMLAIKGWSGPLPPTVAELAHQLQLKHNSTVELVQRAAAAELVRSDPNPLDRRQHLTRLTERGEASIASLSLLHRDELRRFRTEMNDVLRELN
ncbi:MULTISPECIES: MarR family winged helix-turn-helix transcriptional regulator [Candidatus Microthrix]|jgi:DNA-binding MarR family transcriptional regulator|uniref:Regulatory protein MarR n=1 Tax=Candidatus Neomicrothrix parvicella RN1 TaxID=1229780 RepID=R4Z6T0_9ACTN|nr:MULTISPECIES: MarR family transcriptional regulator [Microthrix]NLH68095.1 MarR family transcriptional regulator [Candidatus Microthrix parvicella]MBK6503354.1 MarR family transcriptional regulator [Candidatus Microthrix sp.]MBK7018121.1 MarR family transcriptional regulator [Candidatus Microthrix sp.]MBK7323449.1 MarR family transcriptional regulator [Candidatus Microthrix sp.]MBL0204831.1 MarR family transcriptional regulator [Candidatus Microthrix sp.]